MKLATKKFRQTFFTKEIIVATVIAFSLSAVSFYLYISKSTKSPELANDSVSVEADVKPASNQQIAAKNEQLNWTKRVTTQNINENIDGSIIEAIGPTQKFTGNLKLPKGWTAQYSTDGGVTFGALPSDISTVTNLKISTGVSNTLKPYSNAPLVQPLEELQLQNGSYKTLLPVLYNNKVFQVMKAVTVQDANSQNDFTLNCFDLTTYQQCSSFPTYLSTQVGPLGQGPKNINTPINMQSYVDDGTYGNKGRMYMPGQVSGSYGVVCLDLEQLANCGFTALGSYGSTYAGIDNPVLLSGFVQAGGKLYGHANDSDKTKQTVVCYDLNFGGNGTDAPCTGYDANTTASTTTYRMVEHGNNYYTTGNHILDNNKLFWIVNYSYRNSNATNVFPPSDSQRSWGTVITCFDVVTKAHCAGWPQGALGGKNLLNNGGGLYVGLERPTTLFPWRNTDGTMKAACLIVGLGNSADPTMNCFAVSDGTFYNDVNGTPDHPAKMFPSQWLFVFWTGSPYYTEVQDNDGLKTYIPMYNSSNNSQLANPARGATFCWNWTQAKACTDFPTPRYWHEISSNTSGDTGYFFDGSCMWGVGFGNSIWSFNSKTGESPCRVARTKYTASLTPSDFYCDNQQHVFNWGKVRLAKASMYDFESFDVTVKDSSGATVLAQTNLKNNSELDLTGVSYVDHPNLSVEVVSTVYSTSPWAQNNLPFVNIISNSDEAQYCYTTQATDKCNVAAIVSDSQATVNTSIDTIVSEQSKQIALNQPQNEQCFDDLKVQLSPDKTQVKLGELVTYTVTVDNKANVNQFNLGNINGARFEMTLPTGFQVVSITAGGQQQGNKVVWDNQSVLASARETRQVTLKAPTSPLSLLKASGNKVAAAETQTPVTVQASAIYGGDVYQNDNSSSNNSLVLISETTNPPAETPTEEPPLTQDDFPQQTPSPTTGATGGSTQNTQGQTTQVFTPSVIKNILPPRFADQSEKFFKVVNSAVQPIPNNVAVAIPYASIAFLVAFAIIYIYQAIQEARNRRKLLALQKRYKRTEELRRNYIDLTSHYINTPIAKMKTTLDYLVTTRALPAATVNASKQRIDRLTQHAKILLTTSESSAEKNKNAAKSIGKKASIFGPGTMVPLAGVLIVTLLINAMFVWADKYDATKATLFIQSSFYVLGAIALFIAYNRFRAQKFATEATQYEINLEKQLSDSQSNFIANSSKTLEDDLIELTQLSSTIATTPKSEGFTNGVNSLSDAVSKLGYLNALTSSSVVPTIPNQTIKDLAYEVINSLKSYADERNVSLDILVEPGLTVLVDIDGFKQLLESTVQNAIKFSKSGSNVEVSMARLDKDNVKVTVKDNGVGIPKDKIDQLFEPFGRATDSREYNYEGIGLDLYMDRLIAEQCGGSIKIDSEVNKGTTVTIILPS